MKVIPWPLKEEPDTFSPNSYGSSRWLGVLRNIFGERTFHYRWHIDFKGQEKCYLVVEDDWTPEKCARLQASQSREIVWCFPPSYMPAEIIAPAPPQKANLSDWKVWRDVNRQAGECACGIVASECGYHDNRQAEAVKSLLK
jgi:hypothetical protein